MKKLMIGILVFAASVAVAGASQATAKKTPATTSGAAAGADVHKAQTEKKFKKADANNDGTLDEAELKAEAKAMRGAKEPAGGDDAHYAKVKAQIMAADTNKDGKISHDEYMAWAMMADKTPAAKPVKK